MGVVNLRSRQADDGADRRRGGTARTRYCRPGHRPVIHVTITDEWPLAQAFVIIEAVAGTTAGLMTPH